MLEFKTEWKTEPITWGALMDIMFYWEKQTKFVYKCRWHNTEFDITCKPCPKCYEEWNK